MTENQIKAQALREAADYVYKAWPNIAGAEIGDYLRESADNLETEALDDDLGNQ